MVSYTSKCFYFVDSGVVLHERKMWHELSLFFRFDVCRYWVILRMDYHMPVNKIYLFYRCKVFLCIDSSWRVNLFFRSALTMEESRVSVAGANLNVLLVFYPLENRGNEELWCAWNHYAPRTARPLACLTKLSPVRSGFLKDVYFLCPNASKLKTSITQVPCNKLFANLAKL